MNLPAKRIDLDKVTRDATKNAINTIHDELTKLAQEDIVALPESVFANNFLPMFAGEEVPSHVNERTWAGIAGNPYKPVHIVDDKTHEILFTVPPLYERSRVTPNVPGKGALPIFHVMETTRQLRHMSPIKANQYLEVQLNKLNLTVEARALVEETMRTWRTIFERYGRATATPEGQPTGQVDPNARQELDYDDGIL